jgi:hypothetical protein
LLQQQKDNDDDDEEFFGSSSLNAAVSLMMGNGSNCGWMGCRRGACSSFYVL